MLVKEGDPECSWVSVCVTQLRCAACMVLGKPGPGKEDPLREAIMSMEGKVGREW